MYLYPGSHTDQRRHIEIISYVHVKGNSPVCTPVNIWEFPCHTEEYRMTLLPSFLNVLRFERLYLRLNIDFLLYKCLVVVS